jgi:23S rRNA (cytosine1962-C5)-methyltransferase
MILNKLEKNLKKLKPWADRAKIEAFRLYDKDIPEFPFLVDVYKDYIVVFDKTEDIDHGKNKDVEVIAAVKKLFQLDDESAVKKIILKKRERQKGLNQYQKLEHKNEKIIVQENGISVLVNLWDYLDTGLFIDHRPLRYFFLKNSKQKKFLNLFCYTGVVSLMAAIGGAETVSVDLSDKYLDWAQENFKLNKLDTSKHRFVEQDVLQFIEHASSWPDYKQSFDMIFLDPPTFSNSKSMIDSFEVERDQLKLILNVLKFLKSDGTLYFSTNKRKFKLDPSIEAEFSVKNTTEKTIPQDCHDQKIHQSYEIRFKTKNT